MKANIKAISYHLPDIIEGMDILKHDNPDWDIPKILEKTGIHSRHIAAPHETAVDLALEAGKKLLNIEPLHEEIDLLILVTQSPDYVLPTSACILQDRLGLTTNCMAFDINLGCSGFVNALSIAGSLIESGVVRKSLILCSDTYSKYIEKSDRTCRPIFSDGAAAILLEKSDADDIGPFEFGTDGSGYDRLIVKHSGARDTDYTINYPRSAIEMHGSDIFLFTMRVIPSCINKLLERAKLNIADIDLFVFHQASKLVVDNLVRHMSLDINKVFSNYALIGNTVSASIPIALKDASSQGRLQVGDKIMLIGFGVGLSWGATMIRWKGL